MNDKSNKIEQLRKEIDILDGKTYYEVIRHALSCGKSEQDAEKDWTVVVERKKKLKKELNEALNGITNTNLRKVINIIVRYV